MAITGYLPSANAWFQSQPAPYFPGSTTVAGFTPNQRTAWQQGQNAANLIAQQGNQLGANFLQNMELGKQGNPWLDEYVGRMQDSMQRHYNRNTAQQIGDDAIGAGQFGGSRHGVAQGIALGDLNTSIGDFTSRMYSDAYNKGLDYTLGMTSQAPGMFNMWQGSQMAPYAMNTNIGGQQQALNQSRLNEAMNQWSYYRDMPYNRLQQYSNLVNPGAYSSYGSRETLNPGYQNPWGGALGGALAGSRIASQVDWGKLFGGTPTVSPSSYQYGTTPGGGLYSPF